MNNYLGNILGGLGGLLSATGYGDGDDYFKPKRPRQQKQPKPEDAARMEAAGFTADDMEQTAQAAAEGAMQQDRLGSTLDELAMFFGSMGGNPQAVAIAHERKQQRIAEAVNSANTHALAVIGRQKMQEEREKEQRVAFDKNFGHVITAAPGMDKDVGADWAARITQAQFSKDPNELERVLAEAGSFIDDEEMARRTEEAKGRAKNTIEFEGNAGEYGRAKAEQVGREANARNASEANYAGSKARSESRGRIQGKLEAYAQPGAIEAQREITDAQTSKSKGGVERNETAWLDKFNKEIEVRSNARKAFDSTAAGRDRYGSAEERAAAEAEYAKGFTDTSAAYASTMADQVVSGQRKGLTAGKVVAILQRLPADRKKAFGSKVALIAADMLAKGNPQGQELIDALDATLGSTAARR
jgi:hypothetical protein